MPSTNMVGRANAASGRIGGHISADPPEEAPRDSSPKPVAERAGTQTGENTHDANTTEPRKDGYQPSPHPGATGHGHSVSSGDGESDDDLIIEQANPKSTTPEDVVRVLGPMYAVSINGIRCDLSSGFAFAEFVQTVVAIADIVTKDQLTVWYKCTFTKQELLIHVSGFGKYLYKLVNGYVARTGGAIELSVVTARDAFRARGSPTPSPTGSPEPLGASPRTPAKSASSITRSPSPTSEAGSLQPGSSEPIHSGRYSWPPTGAVIVRGDGTEARPFIVNAIDWTPTGSKELSGDGTESEPFKIGDWEEGAATTSTAARAVPPATPRCPRAKAKFRRRSAPPSSPTPKGVQKRSSSCPPRFSARQKEQIANLLLGGRDNPIDLS